VIPVVISDTMAHLKLLIATLLVVLLGSEASDPTYLRANGDSANTYKLLKKVLGGEAYEVPDCGHPGPHITQHYDAELGTPVFNFTLHVNSDNDRCRPKIKDRQRNEIKADKNSPQNLKCTNGQRVSYSWDVRLDAQFRPSKEFTHIFQIKAVGGNDKMPFITITPKLSNGRKMLQILHSRQGEAQKNVAEVDLSEFAGRWVHVTVDYTCEVGGSIHIRMKQSEQQIMTYDEDNIDLWRSDNSFLRPKWGFYRSLIDKGNLRDENVYFNNFCISNISNGDKPCN